MNSFSSGQVKFAVYGALQGGNADAAHAVDVRSRLEEQLKANGTLRIDNITMGIDPAPGTVKQFCAIVSVGGKDCAFACQEGQTINFCVPSAPGVPLTLTDAVQRVVR